MGLCSALVWITAYIWRATQRAKQLQRVAQRVNALQDPELTRAFLDLIYSEP